MESVLAIAPDAGSYVSESDFFEYNWQRSFWVGHTGAGPGNELNDTIHEWLDPL